MKIMSATDTGSMNAWKDKSQSLRVELLQLFLNMDILLKWFLTLSHYSLKLVCLQFPSEKLLFVVDDNYN